MFARVPPGQIYGRMDAIPSKSHAHRLLICAALSDHESSIKCGSLSDDINATMDCLRQMGSEIEYDGKKITVRPGTSGDGIISINCRESGSTFRFMLPLTGAFENDFEIVREGRLPKRPVSPLYEVLSAHGMELGEKESVPLSSRGVLKGGTYSIAGNVSSQFISGLLFTLPLLEGDSELVIEGKTESSPYIEMTLDALKLSGITVERTENGFRIPGGQKYCVPSEMEVEGDWSNAAFFFVAGALSETGVLMYGLNTCSSQGDRRIMEIVRSFGAEVIEYKDMIYVCRKDRNPIDLDCSDNPDLVPVLAVLGCAAKGRSVFRNVGRLRLKESDRLKAITEVLCALGGEAFIEGDDLIVNGSGKLQGGKVDSYNDHRIVMMEILASIITRISVEITGAEAINKSYPGLFEILMRMWKPAILRKE
jgi:3-phosphoshikimate 1-carboxyvinyltransferase